jgi:enoyl-CoA hydratase/carnithine racemase
MDLLLSGRVITADEAKDMGLVNKVLPPDELLPHALAYARDLAVNCSPFSMATMKNQVNGDWERNAEEARFRALVHVSEHSTHPDFTEGVASYTEKRPPAFAGYRGAVPVQRGWYR